MRVRARHYQTETVTDLVLTGGRIASVEPRGKQPADLEAGWVAPAFFDLQINGALGHSFNSPKLTAETVAQVVATCRAHGIVAFCPTLITASHDDLVHGFATLRQVCESSPELDRAMPCFHLEGPYISPEDGPRGAHPREHVRPPDWEEFCRFQEAAGGRIRLVTLAPELPGALPFIERLRACGVVVALGHTAATPAQIRDAIKAKARLATHLGNGCHAVLPRHDNYLWEQLAADELWASVIADGFHLPAALVKCIARVKGPTRTVLTCDASSLAGMPPGVYREWGTDIEVTPAGRVGVAGTPFLAGSGLFTDACVGNAARFAEWTLAEAVDAAGANPRSLLGLPPVALEPGMPADLVLFDWEPDGALVVSRTMVRGEPFPA